MKKFLAKKPRNALLFSFGINSGLRISDILALNVGDVRDKEHEELYNLAPVIKNLRRDTDQVNAFFINYPESLDE